MRDNEELIRACLNGEANKVYELGSNRIALKVNEKLSNAKKDMMTSIFEAKKKTKDVGSVVDNDELLDTRQTLEKELEKSNQDLTKEDKALLKKAIVDLDKKRKLGIKENFNFSSYPNRQGGTPTATTDGKDGPLYFSKEMIVALEKSIGKRNLTPMLVQIKDIFNEINYEDKVKVVFKDIHRQETRDFSSSLSLLKKIPPFDKLDTTFVELAAHLMRDKMLMMGTGNTQPAALSSIKLKEK